MLYIEGKVVDVIREPFMKFFKLNDAEKVSYKEVVDAKGTFDLSSPVFKILRSTAMAVTLYSDKQLATKAN